VSVLTHGFKQPVPRSSARRLARDDDRFVHEPRERVDRQARRDRQRRVGIETAHEHRKAAERPLLGGVEQVVAPLNRGPHGPVPRGRDAWAAAEATEPRFEVREDLGRRHRADPRSSELNRERQPIKPLAQRRDRGVRIGVGNEPHVSLSRSLDEQALRVLGSQGLQPPDGLAAHAERLTARRQDPQPAARAQQRRRQLRAGVDHVLAVVDDQQHVALGEVAPQRLGRRHRAGAADLERPRDLRSRVRVSWTSREIDEPDAARPPTDLATCQLDRQARLAHTAGAGQRHEPRALQRLGEPDELARAADERGERHGDVVPPRKRTPNGWRDGRRHRAADDHTPRRRASRAVPATTPQNVFPYKGERRDSNPRPPGPHRIRVSFLMSDQRL
jgi:hypothetical protein